jgi:hypothetical protein
MVIFLWIIPIIFGRYSGEQVEKNDVGTAILEQGRKWVKRREKIIVSGIYAGLSFRCLWELA